MRRKKRLIPTLFLAILSWGGLGYLVYRTSPSDVLSIGLFPLPSVLLLFLVLFFALLLSFSLLLNNTRRGLLVAIGITALALLRLFNLFHPLYLILVATLLITSELYFLKQ